jgi:hypothetical protein
LTYVVVGREGSQKAVNIASQTPLPLLFPLEPPPTWLLRARIESAEVEEDDPHLVGDVGVRVSVSGQGKGGNSGEVGDALGCRGGDGGRVSAGLVGGSGARSSAGSLTADPLVWLLIVVARFGEGSGGEGKKSEGGRGKHGSCSCVGVKGD